MAQYPTQSSQLIGGPSLPSYGAFPPNNGIPFHNPIRGSPPCAHSFAAPGPYSRPSTEFSQPSSAPSYGPSQPTYGPSRKQMSEVRCGICFWLVVVLVQVVLVTYRSDTLAKYADLESTANRAAREGSALILEREKSERERAKMRHDREVWGRVPEDRVPPGAYWKPIWPADVCSAYGEREYRGMTLNIPEGWSAMDACMNTPAEIEGVILRRPDRCAFVRGSLRIHGYWMVDWGQEGCQPRHKDIRDLGCTNHRSGLTRIEAQVVGIIDKKEQDWRVMCESTPFTWNGVKYTSPIRCEEGGFGTKVAMWDVPAESCR